MRVAFWMTGDACLSSVDIDFLRCRAGEGFGEAGLFQANTAHKAEELSFESWPKRLWIPLGLARLLISPWATKRPRYRRRWAVLRRLDYRCCATPDPACTCLPACVPLKPLSVTGIFA